MHYAEQIVRLADEGITLFIEVGPQQVLTRLNRQILAGRDPAIIACDNPQRGTLEQLDRVRALWECCGGETSLPVTSHLALPASTDTDLARRATGELFLADHPIEFCDATQVRRARLRANAGRPATAPIQDAPVEPAAAKATSPIAAAVAATPVSGVPAVVVTVPASSAAAQTSPGEWESFLIDFVVEQTGYPPEVVGLDADLEADLGIDSIKKAQLFGELRGQFDFGNVGELKLSDFPTLRHISLFLQSRCRTPAGGDPAGSTTPPAPVRPQPAVLPTAAPQAVIRVAPAPLTHPATPAAPEYQTQAATESHIAPAPATSSPERLEELLINFVVDQTGYPPSVVGMDADLEADLGIDSIKKAQLFGELREQFSLSAPEGLKLSDFSTLRHILRFLSDQLGAASPQQPTVAVRSTTTSQQIAATTAAIVPLSIAAPIPAAAAAPRSFAPLASSAPVAVRLRSRTMRSRRLKSELSRTMRATLRRPLACG